MVFKILFKGNSGIFELTPGYSAYPCEQEVLVQDGLTYLITANTERVHPDTNQKYHIIDL